MKATCNMVWVGLLMLGLSVPAMAKAKGAAGKGPVANLQKITSQLDLSADQKTKVQTILTDLQSKLKDLHEQMQAGADKQTIRPQVQEAMKDAAQKIADTLTPEQRTKFHELMKQARAKHQAKKGGSTTQPTE